MGFPKTKPKKKRAVKAQTHVKGNVDSNVKLTQQQPAQQVPGKTTAVETPDFARRTITSFQWCGDKAENFVQIFKLEEQQ